jgi:hypothetical protein
MADAQSGPDLPPLGFNIHTEEVHTSACERGEAIGHANGRGFSSPVGSKQSKEFPFVYTKADPVYSSERSESFDDILGVDETHVIIIETGSARSSNGVRCKT